MLQAARDAVTIVAGRKREELDTDVLLRHALIHCVQLIGEAAARTGDAGRTNAPGLPWPKIVGMRHILVHDCFSVDHDAAWRVVQDHLPTMIVTREAALANWPEDEPT